MIKNPRTVNFCGLENLEIKVLRDYLFCESGLPEWKINYIKNKELFEKVSRVFFRKINCFYKEFIKGPAKSLDVSVVNKDSIGGVDPRAILIENLGFDTFLTNILTSKIYVNGKYIKLNTVGDLIELKTEQVARIPNIGDGYYELILNTVHGLGLCFSNEKYDPESGEYVSCDVLGFSLKGLAALRMKYQREKVG